MSTRATPCIAWDEEGRHCLAGLLLGVACCPEGTCALCRADRARMLRLGFTGAAVDRRDAQRKARLLQSCPVCGFPPPPPLEEVPSLPRLDRSGHPYGGRHDCRVCERALPRGRRTYCSDACWREWVRRTEMVGQDIVSPAPPPIYRAHFV